MAAELPTTAYHPIYLLVVEEAGHLEHGEAEVLGVEVPPTG